MADTSLCLLALSGHRSRPLCCPNDPNEGPSRSKTHSPDPPHRLGARAPLMEHHEREGFRSSLHRLAS